MMNLSINSYLDRNRLLSILLCLYIRKGSNRYKYYLMFNSRFHIYLETNIRILKTLLMNELHNDQCLNSFKD